MYRPSDFDHLRRTEPIYEMINARSKDKQYSVSYERRESHNIQ